MPSKKAPIVSSEEPDKPAPPLVPPYNPKEDDVVARVFIEAKSTSVFKMPLVDKPPTRFADIKTISKEDWPAQHKTALPDPFPELDEKSRAYLKMWPYGENIIINKRQISKLLTFFMDIREMPLPQILNNKLKEQMEYIRSLLNLVSVEESESEWKQLLHKNFEPFYPYYTCTCSTKKRRAKASPGAKALNGKKKQPEIEDVP
jgi:hypothetical protein